MVRGTRGLGRCRWGFLAGWLLAAVAVQAGTPFAVPEDSDLAGLGAVTLGPPTATKGGAAVLDRLKDLTGRYQPADFEPEAFAATLGSGAEPAFNYVRDHIRLESYRGAFRGAGGTFRSRAGNAADRSLLLAQLLKSKGIETRFVTGQLPPEKSEILFRRMFEPIKGEASAPSPQQENKDLAVRVRARAAHDYAAVRAALGENLPAGGGIDHDAILAELASHVWLQAKSGENWIDLDSAFADAAPGKVYATGATPADQLPADSFQQLTIRVIVERLDGGSLKPETMLELTKPVADLIDRQTFLLHGSPDSGGGVQGLAGGAGAGIAPILFIDGQPNAGKPIEFEDAKSGGGGGGGGGALGGFGGFGGALAGGGGTAQSQFVAEYLEFELNIPGLDKQILRRTLIDRGGAAWRSASSLDPKALKKLEKDRHGPIAAQMIHDISISAGPHDLAGVARAAQALTVENGPAAPTGSSPAPAPQTVDAGPQLWLLALRDMVCQIPTDHWFLPALNDDPSARIYLDSPRISIFSMGVQPDGHGGMLVESQIDWRRDRVRGVPRDASAAQAVAKRKIWYGTLEGALEHELVSRPPDPDNGAVATVQSTSAELGPDNAVAVRPAADGGSAEPKAHNRETAACMSAALKAGDVLVVPKAVLASNEPPAWWAISPINADTRAVWGTDDINASVNRSPLPKPGNNGNGVWELREDGRIVRVKDPGYNRKGGGEEYTTIVIEISLKNLFAVSVIGWGLYEFVRLVILVLF